MASLSAQLLINSQDSSWQEKGEREGWVCAERGEGISTSAISMHGFSLGGDAVNELVMWLHSHRKSGLRTFKIRPVGIVNGASSIKGNLGAV